MRIGFRCIDVKLLLTATVAAVFMLSGCGGYVQPEEKFLKSKVDPVDAVGSGIDFGTVAELVEGIKTAQMTNGKSMEVLGWKKEDNIYSLHVKAKESITLRFVHVLSAPDNGGKSVLQTVSGGGNEISPRQFYYTILQSQPAQPVSSTAVPRDMPKVVSETSPTKVASDAPPTGSQPQEAVQMIVTEKEGPCKGMELSVIANQIECLDKKFKIADAQLNDTYKQVMAGLSDDKRGLLKKEQVSWIKEKESKCANASKEAAGGQMEVVLAADCKLQATESRLSYLQGYK